MTRSDPLPPLPPTSDEGAAPVNVRRKRFLTGRVLAVVLLLGVVGAAAAALTSYERGTDWKHRSEARAHRIAELEGLLAASEEDVSDLTERVDELAAAKALAEGERDGALNDASVAGELTRLSALVAEDLEACVDGTQSLIAVFGDILAYDLDETSSFAREVGSLCGSARGSNVLLQDLIGEGL